MLPIATVTETKETSCIFVPGLSVIIRRLLLLKCSHPDSQQQATCDVSLPVTWQPPLMPPKSKSLPRVSGLSGKLMASVHMLVHRSFAV